MGEKIAIELGNKKVWDRAVLVPYLGAESRRLNNIQRQRAVLRLL